MDADRSPLALILKRNRLQQVEVARALGVSRIAVGAWVHGRATPTGRNLLRLTDFLRQFDPAVTPESILVRPEAAA